ncbi:glycosyltransferase family 4 protein [Rhizobium sp. KVB221]|uniref:Glycosyltransferase family 4 protein n=1 Tax=Rhizobium setariae TaxID=2801340 RepID=A0A936YUG5_9HYPH|nr:glycosyltransferase family 4 protein [Rhizobium setariae]MBL0374839.1 glycosyltransferase family 4 protein [Rhizobium setariae]
MGQPVVIHWGISSFFGWGVYGLNLALNWAGDSGIDARTSYPFQPDQVVIDPLRRLSLKPFEQQSRQLAEQLRGREGRSVNIEAPVLVALGNDFSSSKGPQNTEIVGSPSIGVVFYELPQLSADTLERARKFPLIVCGSTWNERILRAHGVNNVTTVIQGIDPALFHQAPRQGILSDRFMVFSGGKLELRKGQDLVMAGFARFAKRHPEAMLVTAWHSPWPQLAKSIDISGKAAPLSFNDKGKPDLNAWARENGLEAGQFLDLGSVPNALMPPILREMDVALFPNRSEGGTNLVAMEAMACGVPAILSANTGHMDLIDGNNCYALEHQRSVAGDGAGVGDVAGWGESSVEEIDDKLEQAYRDRNDARRRGERGAAKLAGYSWSRTADQMRAIIRTMTK